MVDIAVCVCVGVQWWPVIWHRWLPVHFAQ